jgi:hypothetical protein
MYGKTQPETRTIRPTPILFFNGLNTLPLALQVLLPQADLIFPSTDGQHISTQAPADPPQDVIEI